MKYGQRRFDLVDACGDEVAELVRHEDGQKGDGEFGAVFEGLAQGRGVFVKLRVDRREENAGDGRDEQAQLRVQRGGSLRSGRARRFRRRRASRRALASRSSWGVSWASRVPGSCVRASSRGDSAHGRTSRSTPLAATLST